MAKIVIIGNSAAGFSCCDTLVRSPLPNELIIISEEGVPAYNRNLLLEYLSGNIEEKSLFLCESDYYRKNNVKFINAKVVLLEAKKQRLILKDNAKINYDYLVIASGSRPRLPDIPGKTKEGLFVFYSLGDIKNIKQRLAIADTVAVIGEPMFCAELAESSAIRDKETKIISRARPDSFLPAPKHEWLEGLGLSEFIGEGAQLQAIKLSNGKVIAVSLAIFAGAQSPAGDFLKDGDIKTEGGYVLVNDGMLTNLQNVFACGSVCRRIDSGMATKTWDDAASEGVSAANSLITTLERGKNLCQQTS